MAFLDEAHLHDMDTAGPQFTWVTRRSNHGYMAARLDQVLVNDGFLDFLARYLGYGVASYLLGSPPHPFEVARVFGANG
ncbi:hypothetical protein ACS0TY_033848 [Phlomoides rotata]